MTNIEQGLRDLIEKGERATERPWKFDLDGEHGFGNALSERYSDDWKPIFATTEEGCFSREDTSYVQASANLAVPLAKAVLAAEKMRAEAECLYRDEAGFYRSAPREGCDCRVCAATLEHDAAIEELKRAMEGK